MKQGIQTLMTEAGEAACYALCIIEIAERVTGKQIDVMQAIYQSIEKKYIAYDWANPNNNDNFTVLDPAGFLALMTGKKWNLTKAGADYLTMAGEYVVDRWERVKTGAVIGHFRLPDWDSLADSQTVKYGKIVSKRVFKGISA